MLDTNQSTPVTPVLLSTDTLEFWTTSDAASALNFPERRIRRLLQRNILKGFKVKGRFGEQWRIEKFNPDEIIAKLASEVPVRVRDEEKVGEIFCADPAKLDRLVSAIKEREREKPWQKLLQFFRALLQCLTKADGTRRIDFN